MSTQLRIGVIGTSWWADTMLLPALKSHPRAAIVALCGRNQERAQSLAAKFAIPQVYADYRQMYEEARLDAVVIATPDDTHYEMTMHALDAGLHVLCEKPLALNVAQAKAMLARAEASGRQHMTDFSFRWLPQIRYLCELIADGYLGRCYHGSFRWLLKYPDFLIDGWRARANGVLADLGSHLIDLARCTMGEVDRVSAQISAWPTHTDEHGQRLGPANDAAMVMLHFASGAFGVVHVSAVAHTAEQWGDWHVLLNGQDGSLELSRAPDGRLVLYGARRSEAKSRPLALPEHVLAGLPPEQAYSPKLQDVFTRQPVGCRLFIDAILEDQPISPTFYDGLKAQEVIAAALESSRRGCWVAPAMVGDPANDS
jgi:predicted dehydrogenase